MISRNIASTWACTVVARTQGSSARLAHVDASIDRDASAEMEQSWRQGALDPDHVVRPSATLQLRTATVSVVFEPSPNR
ncbi:MAG TPA: hypothetical protein VJV78_10890 [Polyangiales bacterium]|nr:hypothetical protein [Polyangiales bacterium]